MPLTTLHQPCRDLGRMALAVMLDRIANPDLPPRDVLLRCELIVRKSCGIAPKRRTELDEIALVARWGRPWADRFLYVISLAHRTQVASKPLRTLQSRLYIFD